MHSNNRPNRRDWVVGLAAGALFGFFILGMGGRAGMRVIALATGRPPAFSIEGSIAVSLLGALAGAVVATIFLFVRAVLPTRRWIRAALFWSIGGALFLRGLNPVSALNAGVFIPLFVLHGVLLHLYWCRIHLRRVRRDDAGHQHSRAVGSAIGHHYVVSQVQS